MSKPLPSDEFFDEELQMWYKRLFLGLKTKATYSVQFLSFGLSNDVEDFDHDGMLLEGCLEHTRVTARIKGSSLHFN